MRTFVLTSLAVLGLTGSTTAVAAPWAPVKRAPRSHHLTRRARPDDTFTSTASGGTGLGAGVGDGVASATDTGQASPNEPTVPGDVAKIVGGLAYAPADAPDAVKAAIWAGNTIRHKAYKLGGGHGVWQDSGYDCSGSVSYILHAAGLIKVSTDSSGFESWGRHGAGQWVTVYTNPGHAFVQIAGIRLDTSSEQDPDPAPGDGPRWRPLMTSTGGYQSRHLTQY